MEHKSITATILALGIMISNAGIVSAHNDNFTAKPSNVRETQYWYYDSNHKNFAKSRTIKFSNTRPS